VSVHFVSSCGNGVIIVACKEEFPMITFLVEHQRNKKCSWKHKSEKVSETEAKLKRRPLIIEDGPICLSVTQTV
jgi:hypothetical protein